MAFEYCKQKKGNWLYLKLRYTETKIRIHIATELLQIHITLKIIITGAQSKVYT